MRKIPKKEHIHIIASRIKNNNLAVSDSFTHYKNMDFCRLIEEKYNLRHVERKLEAIKNLKKFEKSDKRLESIKQKIISALNQSDNLQDFNFHLSNMGIKTKLSRGIVFIDQNGVSFKGSEIDRKYSLMGIKNLFNYKNQEKIELYKLNILKNKSIHR